MFKNIFTRKSAKSRDSEPTVSLSVDSSSSSGKSSDECITIADIPKLRRSKSFVASFPKKEIEDRANSLREVDTSFDPFASPQLRKSRSLNFVLPKKPSFSKLSKKSVQFDIPVVGGKDLPSVESDREEKKEINKKSTRGLNADFFDVIEDKADVSLDETVDYNPLWNKNNSVVSKTSGVSKFKKNHGADLEQLFSAPSFELEDEGSSNYSTSSPEQHLKNSPECSTNLTNAGNSALLEYLNESSKLSSEQTVELTISTLNKKDIEITSLQDDLRQMNDAYSKNSKALSEEINELCNEKENLAEELNSCKEQLGMLTQENARLHTQMDEHVTRERDYKVLSEEREEIFNILRKNVPVNDTSYVSTLKALINEFEGMSTEREQLAADIRSKKCKVDELEEEISHSRGMIENLTRGLDATMKETKQKEEETEENIMTMGAKIFDLESAVEKLTQKNSILQKELEVKVSSLKELCSTIDVLHEDLAAQYETDSQKENDAKEVIEVRSSSRKTSETLSPETKVGKVPKDGSQYGEMSLERMKRYLEEDVVRITNDVETLKAENELVKAYNDEATKIIIVLQERQENLSKTSNIAKQNYKNSNLMLYGALLSLLKGSIEALSPALHDDCLSFCQDLYVLFSKKKVFNEKDGILLERLTRMIVSAMAQIVKQCKTNERLLEYEVEEKSKNYSRMLDKLTKAMEDKIQNINYGSTGEGALKTI